MNKIEQNSVLSQIAIKDEVVNTSFDKNAKITSVDPANFERQIGKQLESTIEETVQSPLRLTNFWKVYHIMTYLIISGSVLTNVDGVACISWWLCVYFPCQWTCSNFFPLQSLNEHSNLLVAHTNVVVGGSYTLQHLCPLSISSIPSAHHLGCLQHQAFDCGTCIKFLLPYICIYDLRYVQTYLYLLLHFCQIQFFFIYYYFWRLWCGRLVFLVFLLFIIITIESGRC